MRLEMERIIMVGSAKINPKAISRAYSLAETVDLTEKVVVLGSGPNGVAVAQELAKAGVGVVVIDAGSSHTDEVATDDYHSTERNSPPLNF